MLTPACEVPGWLRQDPDHGTIVRVDPGEWRTLDARDGEIVQILVDGVAHRGCVAGEHRIVLDAPVRAQSPRVVVRKPRRIRFATDANQEGPSR